MIDPYAQAILMQLERRGGARFRDLEASVKNPKTLTRKLAALKGLGLVESPQGGYRLTEKGREVAGIMHELGRVLGESFRTEAERIPHPVYSAVLSRYVRILHDHFGGRLEGVSLFGSIARGDWDRDSDIDLLVVVEGWGGPGWQRTRELWPLKVKLMETEEYRGAEAKGYFPIIQHYPLSKDEASLFHRMYLDASLEGIILYEKDGFLSKLFEGIRERLRGQGAYRVTVPGEGYYWVLGQESS
jgi:predicted nucleotidyltransferase